MVVDDGSESDAVAVPTGQGQSMPLVHVEGRFLDEVVLDGPDNSMFQAQLPHALVLAGALRPLDVRGVVAGLHQWELQVGAALRPECIENAKGHPI